jgi:Ca2+-binding RTX toxin-like protein
VNRYLPTLLVAALVAAAVPDAVTAVTADNTALGGENGNVNLTVADVTTGGVVVSSPATATLTATIDPNQVGTQFYFEYGPNGNLSLRSPTFSLGAGLDPRQVTANLTGLEPGAAYDYRVVAAGPGGLSVGATESFQTASASSARKGSRSKCTIRGSAKGDVLRGTRGRDVICGLGGNDRISGLGGNDVIRGGAGNDRIWGNAGNDALFGQRGNDVLNGGKGRDRIVGGPGRDRARIDRQDHLRSVEKTSRA